MTNIVKIEATGFQDLCNQIRELEEKNKFLRNENQQLKKDNILLSNELSNFQEYSADLENDLEFIKRQNSALKFRAAKDSKRIYELETEITDMKFTRKYLTAEDAGRKFAEELLSMNAELKAEQHENEVVSAMGSYLGDDY